MRPLRAKPAVDILPVIEPVVARVEKGRAVAIRREDAEQAVQVPVDGTERGGGGGSQGVGLHPRQHVEFRVCGPSGEAGHHQAQTERVGVPLQGVQIGQGVVLRRKGKRRVIRDIGKGLVHDHHHVDRSALSRFRRLLVPGCGLGAAVSRRFVHQIGGEVVAEVIGKAVLVEYHRQAVGHGRAQAVVNPVGGHDRDNQHPQRPQAQRRAQQSPQNMDRPRPDQNAQERQNQRGQQNRRRQFDGKADVVTAHSAAHLF